MYVKERMRQSLGRYIYELAIYYLRRYVINVQKLYKMNLYSYSMKYERKSVLVYDDCGNISR